MRPCFLLIRNHLYGFRAALRGVREQPRLKIWVISVFSVGWLASLSWLFYESFRFLYRLGGAAFFLVPRLFTLFFMGLGFMLLLSGAVTGYANLYQTPEVRRLQSWPVPLRDLFYYTLVKSTLMSSWAFFFIILPFIGAFAVYRGWGLPMLVWAAACSLPFVMLCSGLGMGLMLAVVRWIPRGRTLALLAALALLASWRWAIGYLEEFRTHQHEEMMVLVNLVPGLELASHPLMPNRWMAKSILAFAEGDRATGAMYWLLLSSTVGMLFLFLARAGAWIYPESLQRHLSGSGDLALRASRVSRLIHSLFPGRHALRAYGIKDSLLFLRDPSQWSQFLIFFGLLALYFLNLGSLGYSDLEPVWSNLIAFLNMFSLSAVMSSLSARFVFPQMSLESRALWLVGLTPTSLSRLMLVKFLLAWVSLSGVGMILSEISNAMLSVNPLSSSLSRWLMPAVAFSLAGMSTGLGSLFMEIDAKTPAQILSGYGGTLNLILTLLCVILLVLPPGVVSHLLIRGETLPILPVPLPLLIRGHILLLAALAGGVPLWLGARSLRQRDF